MLALEKNGKVWIEPFSDIISVENRHLARAFQPVWAHHANVHPRDRQNAGAAPRRCRDRTKSMVDFRYSMLAPLGKKGTRCLATPIGPTPGPPPPCGMQNVLCKFR